MFVCYVFDSNFSETFQHFTMFSYFTTLLIQVRKRKLNKILQQNCCYGFKLYYSNATVAKTCTKCFVRTTKPITFFFLGTYSDCRVQPSKCQPGMMSDRSYQSSVALETSESLPASSVSGKREQTEIKMFHNVNSNRPCPPAR